MNDKKIKVLNLLIEDTKNNKIYWAVDTAGSITNYSCTSQKYRFKICSMDELHTDIVITITSKTSDQSFIIFSNQEPKEISKLVTKVVNEAKRQADNQSLDGLLEELNSIL